MAKPPDDIGVQPVTVDLLAQVLERLPKGITGEDLTRILTTISADTAKKDEKTRSVRHSNADHEHKSAFSYPEGDLAREKPRHMNLDGKSREVYFNGMREYEEQLTPEEIDAYNAIQDDREARDGRWKVEIKRRGRLLLLTVPTNTIDDRQDVPPLILVLREMSLGAKAADPLAMASRLAALEAAMAARGITV